jgi:hypothetical protein
MIVLINFNTTNDFIIYNNTIIIYFCSTATWFKLSDHFRVAIAYKHNLKLQKC